MLSLEKLAEIQRSHLASNYLGCILGGMHTRLHSGVWKKAKVERAAMEARAP